MIYKYLRKFQEDPTSRVFAPLAEAYRKAGLVDEAIEIAREGLKFHPRFHSGRVALARALFDKKQYVEVLEELTAVVHEAPDNLVAQKLVAEGNLILGRMAEALTAYKLILYFSPHDQETAKIVIELESQAYEKGHLVLQTELSTGSHEALGPMGVPWGNQNQNDFSGFEIKTTETASGDLKDQETDRAFKDDWMRRVEQLQGLLQSVERYRSRMSS